MATLLLELFSEEIPSRMQQQAMEQLQRRLIPELQSKMLASEECRTFVSPRHLAIQVTGLPVIQPDTTAIFKGPKVGCPEAALSGFLNSNHLTLEQCTEKEFKGQLHHYAEVEVKGRPSIELLKEICEKMLVEFSWPKSMKWGARAMQWVRPLHRIIALLDDKIIPVQFGHLTAANITEGHRFLSPAPITIAHAEQYVPALATAHVMVDYAARRGAIAAAVEALASSHGLKLNQDEALLDEVTGLVEWPVPLLCKFDEKFLDLPPEVLISEMKTHQRYFNLLKADGSLSSQFITVANMVTKDEGAQVKEGNARVVRARLADGEFYWNQDQKTKLEDWGKKLSDVVFHAKVGMMNEKVDRIAKLADAIAKQVGYADAKLVERTARLAKADLTSGMVGEFPELQGIMGRYYALAQKEKPEVADAIRDHYKPMGAGDSLPESDLAAIVALADKLDSILSLFAAGEKPTGSKDPLALRRAALGMLRILLDKQWNIDLGSFVIPAKAGIPLKEIPAFAGMTNGREVLDFFRDRMKNVLKDEGIRHDLIEASLGLQDEGFNALAIAKRARTLTAWLDTAGGKDALAAIKRTLNILAAEEKKAKTQFKPVGAANLAQPSEKMLQQLLQQKPADAAGLESLTAPINQFFTDVLVTEPEFREARLGLLAGVRATASSIADFSKIEG